jgi:oligosaccharide repeat unit polymerase
MKNSCINKKINFLRLEHLAAFMAIFAVGVAFAPPWALILILLVVVLGFISLVFGVKLNSLDVFSPYLIFPALWSSCVAVGSIIISVEQVEWNSMVWICCIGALVSYLAGLLAAEFYLAGFPKKNAVHGSKASGKWDDNKLLLLMIGWMFLAVLCMLYEFKYRVGGIPLFSSSWEQTRLYSPEGYLSRIIHLFGYSFMLQAIVLQIYIYSQKKLFSAKTIIFWLMLGFSLFCAALWGSRHTLFIPIAAGMVAFNYLHKRLKMTHLMVLGIAASVFIGAVGYVRKISYFEQRDVDYTEVLQNIGYSARFPVFDQIHNTVAINFETFRQLTETFPDYEPYTYGRQTFFAFYSLLPGKQETLGEIQNRIWNTAFYGNLTSTYMGVPFADFGVWGVLLYTFVFAFFLRLMYFRIRHFPTVYNIMLYSIFSYHLILMPYDNTITKLTFIFDMILLYMINLLLKETFNRKKRHQAEIPID